MPRSRSFPALHAGLEEEELRIHIAAAETRVGGEDGVPWEPERRGEEERKPGASVWRMELEDAEDGFTAAKSRLLRFQTLKAPGSIAGL